MKLTCACGLPLSLAETGAVHLEWCRTCGTAATVPAPSRDVNGDGLFADEDAGYGGDRLAMQEQWLHEARVRLDWVREFSALDAALLEIGAATGEFVATAEGHGHVAIGLETSPWAAQAARRLTGNVLQQDLAAWRESPDARQVDAVVMFHVLEHFSAPGVLLTELLDVVNPAGLLFLEVPNGASPGARRRGVDWWAARPQDHFFHYSAIGLSRLLARHGWTPLVVEPTAQDVYFPAGTMRRPRLRQAVRHPGSLRAPRDLLRAVAVKASHD